MASRLSARDRIAALATLGYTQKEIGRRLGVTDRTIRRWKAGRRPNDDPRKPPREVKIPAALDRKLSVQASAARREVGAHNRGLARGSPTPRDVPVLPPGMRRRLQARDAHGRAVGGTYQSEWVNYSVKGFTSAQIMAVLHSLNKQGAQVQLIYSAPATDPYFEGRVTHAQRRAKLKIRGGSVPELLSKVRASAVEEFFEREFGVKGRTPLYVAVLDPKGAFGKRFE